MKAVVGANVPDYRGMFLRGHGSQSHIKNNGSTVGNTATNHASGNLGVIQGDAQRQFSGSFGVYTDGWVRSSTATGICQPIARTTTKAPAQGINTTADSDWARQMSFHASRAMPTANENRPANIAVKYIVFAGN